MMTAAQRCAYLDTFKICQICHSKRDVLRSRGLDQFLKILFNVMISGEATFKTKSYIVLKLAHNLMQRFFFLKFMS